LASFHAERWDDADRWHRAVRDLVGHGEGIFGMVDGYPPDTPAAPPARLRAIEERCLAWRWRLRDLRHRLARTHGDFHPFNVLFPPPGAAEDPLHFRLLDASRGGAGDPADDLTAMAINYLFFSLEHRAAWPRGLGPLWRAFLETYLAAAADEEVHETAPPFLAWRALVVASPRFYPNLSAEARDAVLAFAERVLDRGFLDVGDADEVLGRSGP
ncbi:MAG: phosphotransferase, partial [Anaeromyxobacteraceae bacterium]